VVCGEPGIGKSRLIAELEERLHGEPHLRLRYFCSPHHQNSALFPFIEQLGHAAAFARDDTPAAKLEKLEALITRVVPGDEDAALLADLLSLPCSERHPLPNLSAQRKKERTLKALLRQLESVARRQPVVMVFEDAHWIDPTSRELLDLTVERVLIADIPDRDLPPEFQPQWTGEPQVDAGQSPRPARPRRLVAWVVGGRRCRRVIDQIAERTDGVPLFVEELTKNVLESGVLREEDDRYVLNRALLLFAIPTTLRASLLARLDRLAPVRHVAQIGAAIGRQFSYALLQAASRLPRTSCGRSRPARRFRAGIPARHAPGILCLKHALVQDIAHDGVLRNARRQLHAQIAGARKPSRDHRKPTRAARAALCRGRAH
jgi:predicted ATPase